jgi:hypothetical protein
MLKDPDQAALFHGIVEMDETYIGGKPRRTNGGKSTAKKRGRGTSKLPVVGIVERHGRAVARSFGNRLMTFAELRDFYKKHVDVQNAIVITDEYRAYSRFHTFTEHHAVNHSEAYVSGDTHTNTVEGFWALIKRAWYGQHHHYSRKWADHYICETVYKYNNRKNENTFADLVRLMVGA